MKDRQLSGLHALGQIEADLRDIAELERRLEQAPLWLPAAVLARQAAEGRRLINTIQDRLDRSVVVTLIGPSGAGKSTLLNALAGQDDLSAVGTRRPTTRKALMFSSDGEAGGQLLDGLDGTAIEVRDFPAGRVFPNVILVDTPDTDSVEQSDHHKVVLPLVERSDVLICVFDAQNPKRRDHADFMAPLVSRFHGESLVAVLNKCDRLDADELSVSVKPDFEAFLQEAWDVRPAMVLLISARSHLRQPAWDAQAAPRHTLDEFAQLRGLIRSVSENPDFGPVRRAANARRIHGFLMTRTIQAARQNRPQLIQARERMDLAAKSAMQQALTDLHRNNHRRLFGVNVRLYQALAQRWLGPVGWLVAIWSRLIVFGSGLAALVRFGNPIHQLWGLLSSWRRFKQSREALSALGDQTHVEQALRVFQKAVLVQWPDIAELLIAGGFDPQVREQDPTASRQASRDLDTLWAERLDTQIDSTAGALSHAILQLLFNLPSLALMGYVGWLTVESFFQARYLTSDFFLHALLTIVLVLLLSFFLLQAVIRAALGRDRIQRRTFEQVERAVVSQPVSLSGDLAAQIDGVLALADDAKVREAADPWPVEQ